MTRDALVTTFACRALLFDLDGVLVNSTACVERTWRRWAAQHELDAEAVLCVAHGRRTVETVSLVAPHLDLDREVAALAAAEAEDVAGIAEVTGARALLAALPADTWAVVTSGVRAVAESRLRLTGLPLTAVMVCADEVARGKPDPEGYLAAARRLGAHPSECLVIEDAPAGVDAARSAGMRVVALTTTHAAPALRAADVITSALGAIEVAVRQDSRGWEMLHVHVPSLAADRS